MALLHIRRYQEADFADVWHLHVLALERAGVYIGNGPWDDDVRSITQVYLNDSGEFLVGIYEGQIIAMGAFKKVDKERAEIKRMRVHPDFQGHGFGQTILQELIARATVAGYKTLRLSTSTVQQAAQGLYRKLGFRETGERREYSGLTDLYFEKELDKI